MRAIFICRNPEGVSPPIGLQILAWPCDKPVPQGFIKVEPELDEQARSILLEQIVEILKEYEIPPREKTE